MNTIKVKPGAKIVDITTGEGQRVFEAFGKSEDEFAEHFGVDIIKYPYGTEAFVVKNSDALGPAAGHTRQILTLGKLIELGATVRNEAELDALTRTIDVNVLTYHEKSAILREVPFLKAAVEQVKDNGSLERFLGLRIAHKVPGEAFLDYLDRVDYWPTSTPRRSRSESSKPGSSGAERWQSPAITPPK